MYKRQVVSSPNVFIGDYTYYDDPEDPTGFEQNNILFHYPEFGDRLVIGKFCYIASGTKFIMGAANPVSYTHLLPSGSKNWLPEISAPKGASTSVA